LLYKIIMNPCFHIEIVRPHKLRRQIKNLHHLGTCERCERKEAWICLSCYSLFCYGEQKHIRAHYEHTRHPLCMSIENSTICCMTCHIELTPEIFPDSRRSAVQNLLEHLMQALHRSPFELSKTRAASFTVRSFREGMSPARPEPRRMGESEGTSGLQNLGNTCFMNSVIQSLNCIEPLNDFVVRFQLNKPNSLCSSLGKLLQQLRNRSKIVPREFYSGVLKKFPQFRGSEQQDAHEFLRVIIEALIEETRGSIRMNKSDIQNLFEGSLLSTFICKECHAITRTLEPILDLSIQIPHEIAQDQLFDISEAPEEVELSRIRPEELPEEYQEIECYEPKFSSSSNISTIQGCLEHFFSYEDLTDLKNLYACPKCRSRVFATRRYLVMKPPKILVIHLKRFYQTGLRFNKINSSISFDSCLSLQKFLTCKSVQANYRLFSVIQHIGSMREGHYITYIKTAFSWLMCDDAEISRVSEEDVKNAQAYMLFYINEEVEL
jgi:ubiquitin C-terminal hydrolase